MDGVTILQTITHITYNWHWTDWCTVCAIVACVGIMGWLVCRSMRVNRSPRARIAAKITVLFIILTFIGVPSTIIAARLGEKVENKTYQVLLDDNVRISEFRTQYEILEEQGITYIVRERN